MREIERDNETGLALVADKLDPPRYYLSLKRRIDLLCIGDVKAALAEFRRKVEESKSQPRKPPKQ